MTVCLGAGLCRHWFYVCLSVFELKIECVDVCDYAQKQPFCENVFLTLTTLNIKLILLSIYWLSLLFIILVFCTLTPFTT